MEKTRKGMTTSQDMAASRVWEPKLRVEAIPHQADDADSKALQLAARYQAHFLEEPGGIRCDPLPDPVHAVSGRAACSLWRRWTPGSVCGYLEERSEAQRRISDFHW